MSEKEILQYKTFVTAEILFLLDYIAPTAYSRKIQDLACEIENTLPDRIHIQVREKE